MRVSPCFIRAIILTACLCAAGAAQEQAPPPSKPAADNLEAQATAPDEAEQEKKEQAAEIGFVLIGGIGILGVFLIVFALLVGRRLRRQLRTQRGPTQQRDPLWYLKDSKSDGDGSE